MTRINTWRALSKNDIPAIVALFNTANRVDAPARVINSDDIEKATATSNPASNTRVGIGLDGEIVAFASVLEPAESPLALEVEAIGVVHPGQRGAGIGTDLVRWQESRARELLQESPKDSAAQAQTRWLSTVVQNSAHSSMDLLQSNGFVNKRTWLEMARDLSLPVPEAVLPSRIQVTTPENHSEETWLAYNDSFRDHWGSRPDTWQEWLAREKRADYRPDLSFVAVGKNPAGKEEVAGLVISRVNPNQFEARGGSFVYIHLMGVRRNWRGLGIASGLLLHSMRAFAEAGFERAELNVDSNSLTGAVSVYEKIGFREAHRHSTFVKEL